MKNNGNKSKELGWREYKTMMKKKKIDLVEQRLERELERKKKDEENQIKKQNEIKEPLTKKIKLNKKIKKCQEEEENEINNNEQIDEQVDEQIDEQINEQINEDEETNNDTNNTDSIDNKNHIKKSHLDNLKDELNQLTAKKTKKKKKPIKTEIKLDDEDNLDLKLDRTISIALPASIILNAQTSELKAYLIGQIARCAAIFNVNEIIVFDEFCTNGDFNDDECEDDKVSCVRQMANLLRYLECPQYLRKSLFPLHKDFRSAGVINPLDTKHHLRFEDESEFREGVVNKSKNGKSFVYVGLQKEALVNKEIEEGTRVTVKLDIFEERNYLNVVSPYLPTKKLGYYWGYDVRVAKSISKIFENSTFGKYDLIIGTSDKGDKLEDVEDEIDRDFKHALIVFGGLKGLEFSISNDPELAENKDPKNLFQFYLNTCPNQGSNVIRCEEATLISLSVLQQAGIF